MLDLSLEVSVFGLMEMAPLLGSASPDPSLEECCWSCKFGELGPALEEVGREELEPPGCGACCSAPGVKRSGCGSIPGNGSSGPGE